MDVNTFDVLLTKVFPYLSLKSPKALPPEQRLAITLRYNFFFESTHMYLATGDQMLSIALAYREDDSTAHAVVKRTCATIVVALSSLYLRYLRDWNFPNCIGAIDGNIYKFRHHQILALYVIIIKKTFSIVLLAACDYKYKFTRLFAESNLSTSLRDNTLNLSKRTAKLLGSELQTPYFFVADDAFPLAENMKPYSKRYLSVIKKFLIIGFLALDALLKMFLEI
ncbi:hypothetical protein ACFW04_014209 [Cataglyphis niger]